jgi:adenine-specific DNA-methyltransferase
LSGPSFLLPAASRLQKLGSTVRAITRQLQGVEIHEASVREAQARLAEKGFTATVTHSDFFDFNPQPKFDAVIGNPPFIRYQSFSGDARAKSMRVALAHGVRLTALASSWAAFTIHASEFLNDTGRLAMVLPAELLSVNYAAEVRRFLLSRFAKVRLVLFDNLVFPGVSAEVVLLLAEGRGSATSFEVFQVRDVAGLAELSPTNSDGFVPIGGQKWTSALIPTEALRVYTDLTTGKHFNQMREWGETYLGCVTGNNSFFALTVEAAAALNLGSDDLIKISPPGARHLRGLTFTERAWAQIAKKGGRCYLFAPNEERLSSAARAFIRTGEKADIQSAYKCAMRSPWWRVPQVLQPDILFTYMNHDRPRLTTNEAGVNILNSLYGIRLNEEVRSRGKALLPIACLNSLTLLGSEVVGRAYGGGLLKHEPREADLLPVPSFDTLGAIGNDLKLLKPQLALALRANDLPAAVKLVDEVVLQKHMKLGAAGLTALREAREVLFNRRLARAKSGRGEH